MLSSGKLGFPYFFFIILKINILLPTSNSFLKHGVLIDLDEVISKHRV